MFSAETLAEPDAAEGGRLAFLATVVAVELDLLNRLLDTVNLTRDQWLVCIVVSLAIVVVVEVKKLLRIQDDRRPATRRGAVDGGVDRPDRRSIGHER